MAKVDLNGISKKFRNKQAVAELSLEVADGEFVVLLGPTGAGKTTTLRLIAGLEQPDGGSIEIAGRDVTRLSPAARDVSFVFQQFSLYPHYTVFENLAFPLKAPNRRLDKTEIEKTVTEVARMLRIDHKLGNRATQLSGGEMQRVAIGRALVRRPSIYLMDEPLSSLDAKLREDLRIELKRIQMQLGATLLYVTHDQIEAMTMADRVGVLHEGRLAQIGTPRQVYSDPDSIYVAQRLGSPTINLLPPSLLLTAPPEGVATLGVRPEDIAFAAGGRTAKVLSVEHLGAEMVVLLDLAGVHLHALAAPSERVRTGEEVSLIIAEDRVLFFDAAGNRLRPGKVRHAA